jgi:hypothetical protein
MTRPVAYTYRPQRVPRSSNVYQTIISSLGAAAQPSATSGTSITPAQNAYGNYATVLAAASVTHKVYGIWVCIVAGGVSTEARDHLVTIGTDPAGGTTFADKIVGLLAPAASPYLGASSMGGHWYWFPLEIEAGTTIGAKAAVSHVTVRTVRVFCILECNPTRPDLLRTGTTVTTYGAVTASAGGTAVLPGTVAEGDYVQLGTALTERTFYWSLGIGCASGSMENTVIHGDLALDTAGVKRVIVANRALQTTSGEVASSRDKGAYGEGLIGDTVYARLQQAGTLNVYTCAAYGVS